MAFPLSTHSAASPSAPRRGLAGLLGLFGVGAADSLLFRTHLYPSVLDPDSSTGLFELTLWNERRAQQRIPRNSITGVGDSRFLYLPRVANRLLPETGYVFRS